MPSLIAPTYLVVSLVKSSGRGYLDRRSVSLVGVANTRQSSLQSVPLCISW